MDTSHANPNASALASHPSNKSMSHTRRLRAATLAVGTEVVDGQIIDRNSAWISQMVTDAGVQILEHRAVADDREDIARGLRELADRCDLIFVTGGLGPTSDDFTRELISEVFAKPLEFDQASWQQIQDMLATRGVAAKEIQKQQCYFPQGAQILKNPAGTANAFSFTTRWQPGAAAAAKASAAGPARDVRVYALPGPPSEIAAIWALNLETEMSELTPESEREELVIMRCLGKPESDVAEKTEAAIAGSGLRVGYRANLPYVEVKLWVPAAVRAQMAPVLSRVEAELGDWIISRGKEDLADPLLKIMRDTRLVTKAPVDVIDCATAGFLQDRLVSRIRELKYKNENVPFVIQTRFGNAPSNESLVAHAAQGSGSLSESTVMGISNSVARGAFAGPSESPSMMVSMLSNQQGWLVELHGVYLKGANGGKADLRLELTPPKHYSLDSERARKFLTESIFLHVKQHVERA